MSAPGARYRPELSKALTVGVVTTAASALGCILGALPIGTLFTDNRWFIESIGAILVVTVPAMLLRVRATPRASQLLPGLVLLVLYATALYLHHGSIAGLLPGSGTWQRLLDLHNETRSVITNGTTPLHSTAGIRLYVVPAVGLLAALTDWLTVVRRAPALAGIGFLAIFTVVGAVKGSAVGWVQFTIAAIGYLIILSAASRRDASEWGRIVPRAGQTSERTLRLGASGARIATIAVVLAVIIPSVLPGLGRNVFLDAFHRGGGGDGGGEGTAISAFADLAGELRRQDPIDLLKVKVTDQKSPFYLRSKVLTLYTPGGWRAGGTIGQQNPTPNTLVKSQPQSIPTTNYTASFKVLELKDSLPFFGLPKSFDGLRKDWGWDIPTATLSGTLSRHNETYGEDVSAPNPTVDELRAAPNSKAQPGTNLVPDDVKGIVAGATAGASTAYDRALAILSYFSPSNGFTYNLQTKTGDTGDALLDFLRQKQGFCQQYAAAMAIMLRIANIPSRVVLGYTHGALNGSGEVTVTSHDAHAWVEAYFEGIGWIPFDPTPLSGPDATRSQQLPWENTSTGTAEPSNTNQEPSANTKNVNSGGASGAQSSTPAAVGGGSSGGLHLPFGFTAAVLAVLIVLILVAIPPGLRRRQRTDRYRNARRGSRIGPIWQELQATATDAGIAWPPPTTPRQVPGWLQKHGVTPRPPMDELALATERELYADPNTPRAPADVDQAIASIKQSRRELLTRMTRWARLKMRFWPRSTMAGRRTSTVRPRTDRKRFRKH
ncbi:MAG: transglutaminaseTgpA domain-containing protein [Jatrophihabitans sp.]